MLSLYPIKTPLISPGDDLVALILKSVKNMGLKLIDGDVIAISSKVLATARGNIVRLSDVNPSEEALEYAGRYSMDPRLVEVILGEAEEVLGGIQGILLTVKDGMLMPNAGVDTSNVMRGHVILLPRDPFKEADDIRRRILEETGRRVGVIVVDSRVMPLRRGTVGVAVGVSGFRPVKDLRGQRDLYGNVLKYTLHSLADDLASAAHLLMGECRDMVPAVLIRGAPVEMVGRPVDPSEMVVSRDVCLYMASLSGSGSP